jgi:DNA-binding Lrp family transcriptional regulator
MTAEAIITELERRLLGRLQSDFPIAADSYGALALDLEATRGAAHDAVQRLRRAGVIRRIGASYVPARLGYVSTLVAACVEPACLVRAAACASGFAEVTHNYEREDRFNLWFTVIARNPERMGAIVAAVRAVPGVGEVRSLPALRTFKIRVDFQFEETSAAAVAPAAFLDPRHPPATSPVVPCLLDAIDRRLIARTCGDIGGGVSPFADLAAELGTAEADVLARLQFCRERGLMRRFGAVLRHRVAGFMGNGMSVWNVPDERVDGVGRRLAESAAVSHCYERPRFAGWPYSLYGMMHGRDRDACRRAAERLAAELAIADWRILFSAREFKKTSRVYFGEQGGL